MKTLVIGDSEELSQIISLILKVRWPQLSFIHSSEAREGMELIYREQPDIVMLHFPERSEGSPALDCFDLISQIRSFSDVPLIILSEKNDVMDKIRALEMGADAYLTFPLNLRELLARVRSLLRH